MIFFLLLLIFGVVSKLTASTGEYMDEAKKRIVIMVQDELYADRYQPAISLADSLISQYPRDPIGFIIKAGLFVSEMTDAEEKIYDEKFHTLIDSGLLLAENNLTDADSSTAAWMYLWIGHARAYRSLFESRFGSLPSALSNGFKAKSAYQEGLKFDSSLYDLYGGLGMYHYWKSAKAGILRWIRVFNNDKEKGIDELYLTIDSSEFSQTAAQAALVWIYIDKKEFDSSLAISYDLFERYPEGRTFLWAIAEAEFEKGDFKRAIGAYQKIKEKLKVEPGNFYNMIEVDYRIFEGYEALADSEAASQAALQVMEYVNIIPKATKERQKGKINKLIQAGNKK